MVIEPPVLTLLMDMPPKPAQLLRLMLSKPRTALAVVKLGAFAMAPAEKAFRRGDDAAAIEAFGRDVLGRDRFRNLSHERYVQVWDNRAPDRAQMLGAGYPPLSNEQVSTVGVPVLLVSGSESPAVFHRLNEHLLKHFSNATLIMINNASHIAHEDALRNSIKPRWTSCGRDELFNSGSRIKVSPSSKSLARLFILESEGIQNRNRNVRPIRYY